MFRKFLISLTAMLVGFGTVGAATPVTPASAWVSSVCHRSYYYNSSGQVYKVFISCDAGNYASGFYAVLICTNGTYSAAFYGWRQTQPGPWYGSTATCAAGYHATSSSISFD